MVDQKKIETLKSAVDKNRGSDFGDIELSFQQANSKSVGWADGKPHLEEQSEAEGICVRVLKEGGMGVVTSRQIESEHLDNLIHQAQELAKYTPKDSFRQLARIQTSYPKPIPSDPAIFQRSTEALMAMFRECESKVLKVDSRIKKVVRFQIDTEKGHRALISGDQKSLSEHYTSAGFSAEILAVEKDQNEVAWDMSESRFANNIDIEKIALETATEAVRSLGGKSLPSGKYPVVVHPNVAVQFLDLFSSALSAEEVLFGRSFLKNHLGKSTGSKHVTLMDDPTRPDEVASSMFDDEGTPHKKITIVEDGILKSYLTDLRSAKKMGVEPTGHGIKGGLAGSPHPQPTNFFLKPGKSKRSELLSAEKKVFLLKSVMGLHMADPLTGEFSLGASGDLYENGKFVRPVRGVTIAGQLKQIFEKIIAVSDDLKWVGNLGSSSFLISDLVIAG